MNTYKFYPIFRFILQAFKQVVRNVEHGFTDNRGWSFTTPHGCWTLTLACEAADPPPRSVSVHPPHSTVIFVDELGGAYV